MNEKQIIKGILETLKMPELEIRQALESEYIKDKNKGIFDKTSAIVTDYIKKNISEFDLNSPKIEGESKRIFVWKDFALIELKPTMYSFTFNRYGTVEGTDEIRTAFWEYFGSRLNSYTSDYLAGKGPEKFKALLDELFITNIFNEKYPFISNYLGHIKEGNKIYIITRFAEKIPPIEVVWKNYLVGTMKHNLKQIDRHPTRKGKIIEYEGRLPKDIIRFDWRNPLPDKDEAIPDEFASFYVDTESARRTIRLASYMLNNILQEKGYELIDLCYFINHEGNMIFSEITPDGMRIRKKGESYDKDLWRAGKEKDVINKIWKKLYFDLSGKEVGEK